MICDVVSFNGEKELFEIRYNILKNFVDEFRVVEFDQTFSGKPKKAVFNQKWDKVKHYFIIEEMWSKYKELAMKSPNTEYGKGAEHWIREFCQKESIKDCLTDLEDNDIVLIGDVDEIWNPEDLYWIESEKWGKIHKLKLLVYSYWLNNRSNEEFWGTILGSYNLIKNKCLNHLRNNPDWKTNDYFGWHFTSQGGYEKVKEKLTDSYTKDSYASDWILDNLEKNIKENKDFLGRKFIYKIEEENWPEYLKENKGKYRHLLK